MAKRASNVIPQSVEQESDGGLTVAVGDLRISIITRPSGITFLEAYSYRSSDTEVHIEDLPSRSRSKVLGLSLVPRDPS